MRVEHIAAVLTLVTLSGAALAGQPGAIPEPETLALLAVGAAAVAVVRWLKKK